MIIASMQLKNLKTEKRVAITPEIAKKYISFGFEVCINKDYGSHLGFNDNEYKSLGVKVLDEKDVIKNVM